MTAQTTPPVPHPPSVAPSASQSVAPSVAPSAPQSVAPSVTPSAAADQPAPAVRDATTPAIGELLGRLDGLEHRPLPAQVEVLDAVRRGLDQALSPAPEQR